MDLAGEINNFMNGLLLFKPMAWAFDTSRLCFTWDQGWGHYVPHLLDHNLKDTTLMDKLLELAVADAKVGPCGLAMDAVAPWMASRVNE
jgi:hypothetical protein